MSNNTYCTKLVYLARHRTTLVFYFLHKMNYPFLFFSTITLKISIQACVIFLRRPYYFPPAVSAPLLNKKRVVTNTTPILRSACIQFRHLLRLYRNLPHAIDDFVNRANQVIAAAVIAYRYFGAAMIGDEQHLLSAAYRFLMLLQHHHRHRTDFPQAIDLDHRHRPRPN